MDDGLGKKRVSVILEDDETLSVVKVPVARARPREKHVWSLEGELISIIDQKSLCEAIISIYEQVQQESPTSKSEHDSEMLGPKILILMLLGVSSQMKWTFMDRSNPVF